MAEIQQPKLTQWAPPPAPDADRQWHYLADHLAAIRRYLLVIAASFVLAWGVGAVLATTWFLESMSST